MNRKGSRNVLSVASIAALVVAAILFDLFNFITTDETFKLAVGGNFYFTILAAALSLADLASMARLLTPETVMKDEPEWVWALTAVWFIAMIGNAFFTWYFVAVSMQVNSSAAVPVEISAFATSIIPVAISIVVVALRFGLMYTLAHMLDQYLNMRAKDTRSSVKPLFQQKPISKPKDYSPAYQYRPTEFAHRPLSGKNSNQNQQKKTEDEKVYEPRY